MDKTPVVRPADTALITICGRRCWLAVSSSARAWKRLDTQQCCTGSLSHSGQLYGQEKQLAVRRWSQSLYRVTTINMTRKGRIGRAEWCCPLCRFNPFPAHVYCRHPVFQSIYSHLCYQMITPIILLSHSTWKKGIKCPKQSLQILISSLIACPL